MIATCAWCPACLAKCPDLRDGDMCPTHIGVEVRKERASAGFYCATYHHPELWDAWRGDAAGPSPNQRARKTRKPRPKKSQRKR
ncbi:hypothetical protein SEA_GUSANITA_69 [Arthrobacter phage Gusanita]|nr:hypothetical protein SEA_GUSANITA_69 [Arthrobacter phage Gusanita]